MKKLSQPTLIVSERKWVRPLFASCLVSILLYLAAIASFKVSSSSFSSLWTISRQAEKNPPENAVTEKNPSTNAELLPSNMPNPPPRLAYLISGSKGDGERIKRVLQALYHPRNQYILHLDLEALPAERIDLARYAKHHPTLAHARNVEIIGKANLITYTGPTMTACTLHAAAILLRKGQDWDWFINLSASDYPLVTQDGK